MRKLRCFVAMPFGKSDTDRLYEKAIKRVLDSLSISSIRVDRLTHNDRIDARIRKEIKDSDFVIADLTYARPSVYWEAGYAERIVPVIYTCRHDHFRGIGVDKDPYDNFRVHFDLANANIIPWTDELRVLENELRKRILFIIRPLREFDNLKSQIDGYRKEFQTKSLEERQELVDVTLEYQLRHRKYKYTKFRTTDLIDKAAGGSRPWFGFPRQKKIGTTLLWLSVLRCNETLSKKD